MANNNFINGLQNASDYLNTTEVGIPTGANISDVGVDIQTSSYSLKELICSLLAGNGLNLPNLQICMSVNIARLLNEPTLPNDIRNALADAEKALNDFTAHTNIENVLNRLNSAVAEFAAVANMINFCGTPVIPRPIPNVLQNAMGSFLGTGKALLDTLGTMAESDIGGCIGADGKFSPNLFTGGLLKQLGDNFDDLANLPQSIRDQISNDLNAFASDIKNLIEFENNFASTESKGGSTFNPGEQAIHTGVGVALDAENMTFAQSTAIAANLQSLYDQLNKYDVDENGNNIFHYLLTPDMIARLEDQTNPTVPLAQSVVEYDYCGKPTGVSYVPIQSQQDQSIGAPVQDRTDPATLGLRESGTVVTPPPATTTNLGNSRVVSNSVPTTPIGRQGDTQGDVATDGAYIYIASADYDGTTAIWTRAQLTTW